MKQKLEIAADLVPLETALETITAPPNKLITLLHPIMRQPPIESIHRINDVDINLKKVTSLFWKSLHVEEAVDCIRAIKEIVVAMIWRATGDVQRS